MDLFTAFSSRKNLQQAFLYLRDEMDENSLPLDPLWRPAISAVAQLGDDFFDALQTYLREGQYHPDAAKYVYAQKDNSAVRPICVFSVVDRIVFQALLNPLVLGNIIDGKLFNSCFCNRVLGEEKYLKPYSPQWTSFCDEQIKAFNDGFIWRFEFDIHTYYENIHIETLMKILKEKFQIRDERLLYVLESQLKKWSEKPTLCGLPQGANASNVLANAYLHPVDTFLDDLKGKDNFEHFRYNDDTVIMAKSADEINSVIEKAVLCLRQYNLNLNEKSKLEQLTDTQSIEEVKFYNPYGQPNETSRKKLEKISKKIPATLKKLKKGRKVEKNDISGLKYYLRAGVGLGDSEMVDNLIAAIITRPSLIFWVGKYLGYYFSQRGGDGQLTRTTYENLWKTYHNNALTQWTKFWLLKVLSTPSFAISHKGFQSELDGIIKDPAATILRPLALFYRAYSRQQINPSSALGFTADDIKKYIRQAKTETEQAIYYYFTVYLSGVEDRHVIRELIYDALRSQSPEIQTMGLFLVKNLYHLFDVSAAAANEKNIVTKWNIKLDHEITGGLSRIYFKLPPQTKIPAEKPSDDFLTDDGRIAQDKLPQFFGTSVLKVELVGKVRKDIATIATHIKKNEAVMKSNIVRLITKHVDDGDYFYADKRISVSKGTLCYDVFDILFSYANQDGSLSYQKINGYLVKRGHPAVVDEKVTKRIQNAISNKNQGFFRSANIKNKTPDGQPLVEVIRGRGLKLNNPILK